MQSCTLTRHLVQELNVGTVVFNYCDLSEGNTLAITKLININAIKIQLPPMIKPLIDSVTHVFSNDAATSLHCPSFPYIVKCNKDIVLQMFYFKFQTNRTDCLPMPLR